jgi:Trk K+ transport system NAD-binding subunit
MELLDLLVHSEELGIWIEERLISNGAPLDGASVATAKATIPNLMNVLAIRRPTGDLIANPSQDLLLSGGDTLVLLLSK